jgi:hypothetical protein
MAADNPWAFAAVILIPYLAVIRGTKKLRSDEIPAPKLLLNRAPHFLRQSDRIARSGPGKRNACAQDGDTDEPQIVRAQFLQGKIPLIIDKAA